MVLFTGFPATRFLSISLAALAAVTLAGCSKSRPPYLGTLSQPLRAGSFEQTLPIPPPLKDEDPRADVAEFSLTAQESKAVFLKGKTTATYAYNGRYLGPTIRVKKGDTVKMNVKNTLNESTTVHWHGLHIPGHADGGPHQVIQPKATWRPSFKIIQDAATLWYHPHPKGITGEQVYRGMAGFFIVSDEKSGGLGLPDDYGRNDIPLVVQDRKFARDGSFQYKTSLMYSQNGMFGDKILVNGAINPVLKVGRGKIRFRLLNGSNTRVYRFSLSDGSVFTQIATDAGFLAGPVDLTSLEMSPGERAEIVIDFSRFKTGDSLFMVDSQFNIIKFKVGRSLKDGAIIPSRLGRVEKLDPSSAVRTRTFILRSAGGGITAKDLTINGKLFDLHRVDERVKPGAVEIWEFKNLSRRGENLTLHPVHIHGVRFLILDRNGRPPGAHEAGWKDTFLMRQDETVRVIMRFENYTGKYMYHCHMLEHEDAGMMGQFEAR